MVLALVGLEAQAELAARQLLAFARTHLHGRISPAVLVACRDARVDFLNWLAVFVKSRGAVIPPDPLAVLVDLDGAAPGSFDGLAVLVELEWRLGLLDGIAVLIELGRHLGPLDWVSILIELGLGFLALGSFGLWLVVLITFIRIRLLAMEGIGLLGVDFALGGTKGRSWFS